MAPSTVALPDLRLLGRLLGGAPAQVCVRTALGVRRAEILVQGISARMSGVGGHPWLEVAATVQARCPGDAVPVGTIRFRLADPLHRGRGLVAESTAWREVRSYPGRVVLEVVPGATCAICHSPLHGAYCEGDGCQGDFPSAWPCVTGAHTGCRSEAGLYCGDCGLPRG
jgi:hypothetical protein